MERLKRARENARYALNTLEQILKEPVGTIVRDASIQRFEYTFETVWKLLKVYLLEMQGVDAGSPKACFREAFKVGILTQEQTEQGMKMTDDRNLTSHTYIEAIAALVYSRLHAHAGLMNVVVEKAV
jgi:nucleotidyltransferase substrate binding protein (TIGR01987 family)